MFFQSIWQWLTEHASAVLAVVSPTMVASIIATIFYAVKLRKSVSITDNSSKELKTVIQSNSGVKEELKANNETINKLSNKVEEQDDLIAQLMRKANTELEILQILCTSIKQITAENKATIDGLIANAKYAETKSRADALKLLEDSKAEVEALQKKVNANTEKAKKIISAKVDKSAVEIER